MNSGLLANFEHEFGVQKSLFRSSEAQKALLEGKRVYKKIDIKNQFNFTFSTSIGNAQEQHSIKFNFSEEGNLPFRIKVIIGKNGTGKTRYIAQLASTLSGHSERGKFSSKNSPPFSRVIAVSYSLFDSFPRPEQTKTYSYYYCGFQGKRGFLTTKQINTRLYDAITVIEKSLRTALFGRYISMVLSEDIALEMLDEDFTKFLLDDLILYDSTGYSRYSSGQIVIILIIAELVAYITTESLVLIDEPETHLHPNSVSLFLNVINLILKKFNSYSIITTHSPQVVQEVPSKDVIVLERIDDIPITRGLDIESFGENLNTITERIFHTSSHDEYYRKVLTRLSEEQSYNAIIKLFERNSLPLSLNAKIFLQSLYSE